MSGRPAPGTSRARDRRSRAGSCVWGWSGLTLSPAAALRQAVSSGFDIDARSSPSSSRARYAAQLTVSAAFVAAMLAVGFLGPGARVRRSRGRPYVADVGRRALPLARAGDQHRRLGDAGAARRRRLPGHRPAARRRGLRRAARAAAAVTMALNFAHRAAAVRAARRRHRCRASLRADEGPRRRPSASTSRSSRVIAEIYAELGPRRARSSSCSTSSPSPTWRGWSSTARERTRAVRQPLVGRALGPDPHARRARLARGAPLRRGRRVLARHRRARAACPSATRSSRTPRGCCTTSASSRSPIASWSAAAQLDRVRLARHPPPPRHRRRAAARHRRLRPGGGDRARPPRAHGRPRLPARADRRRDPRRSRGSSRSPRSTTRSPRPTPIARR